MGLHLAYVFQKKRFRKWLRKKGAHTSKQHPMNMSGGSQGGRLACSLLKQETRVRAEVPGIVVRTPFFLLFFVACLKILFQFLFVSDFLKTSSRNCFSNSFFVDVCLLFLENVVSGRFLFQFF